MPDGREDISSHDAVLPAMEEEPRVALWVVRLAECQHAACG